MFKLFRMMVLSLVMVALLPLSGVFAQTEQTVNITEAQLNSSARVTNPSRTRVTNVYMDVQEGQVVVSATVAPRRGDGASAQVVVTYVPKLVNSGSRTRLQWDVTAIMVNGQAYSGSNYNAVRDAYAASLRNNIDAKLGRTFNVTSVTVSADTITVVGTR